MYFLQCQHIFTGSEWLVELKLEDSGLRNRTSTVNDYYAQWLRSRCLCIDSEKIMATAEQMQEALQQIESARAQKAEQERSALIPSPAAIRQDRRHMSITSPEALSLDQAR